jgi:outer membrane protein OmpA-like peptidoglycan-associated protein
MHSLFSGSPAAILMAGAMAAQAPVPSIPQPIYRVTVVSRNLQAVNYEHRGGPTPIDFRGTVLLPDLKGTAIVDSHRGSVSIDAKLKHLDAPSRFGREYLTYVLWAISPQGRPTNLGEVLADSSNNAHIKVTTGLQAFGMIVTAEPYYSVTQPSDVVVAENVVRPDTIGEREEVTAKYELLPRGRYTMTIQPAQLQSVGQEQEKLPYNRYEAVLELYQAQNAVQIARSQRAEQLAPEAYGKAEALLSQAQNMSARKMDTHAIVSTAREATQMAEDARTIAIRRRDENRLAREAQQSQEQSELRRKAEEEADRARADANREAAERAAADQARAQAERNEAIAQQQAAQRAPIPPPPNPSLEGSTNRADGQRQQRAALFAQLDSTLATRDTPRGLVVTISDSLFEPGNDRLRAAASQPLVTLAGVLASHPGLRVNVEGYADTEELSDERARSVRTALIASGAPGNLISEMGYGNTRPITNGATAAGREKNRRVEIIISGDSIGNKALWDHPYTLQSHR